MVSRKAIAVVVVLNLLRISVFLRQPRDCCSPAPHLPSCLFVLAMILLIGDWDLLPKRYLHLRPSVHAIAEIGITVFIYELALLVGWCGFERLAHMLALRICHGSGVCEIGVLTVLTMALAVFILFYSVQAVYPSLLSKHVDRIRAALPADWFNYFNGIKNFCHLNREDRMQAVRVLEDQRQEQEMDRILEEEREREGMRRDVGSP